MFNESFFFAAAMGEVDLPARVPGICAILPHRLLHWADGLSRDRARR